MKQSKFLLGLLMLIVFTLGAFAQTRPITMTLTTNAINSASTVTAIGTEIPVELGKMLALMTSFTCTNANDVSNVVFTYSFSPDGTTFSKVNQSSVGTITIASPGVGTQVSYNFIDKTNIVAAKIKLLSVANANTNRITGISVVARWF
jgi:hypothetical protein